MAPQTVLSECERLIQQPEEALKHQELEAGELEVDSSSPIAKITASGASATQTLPRVEHSDRRDAEIRCTAPSKRSSQSHISQARTSLRSKHARSQTETASHRFLSPKGTIHRGSILSTLLMLPSLSSQPTPVLDVTRTIQYKLKI